MSPNSVTSTNNVSEAKRLLLEKYLEGAQAAVGNVTGLITRRIGTDPAPLSLAQQQVWIHSQVAPDLPVYNEPFTVHRHGPLDIPSFERALSEVIRRHEAWRTTFPLIDGHPAQVVGPPFEIKLPLVDLTTLPLVEREEKALQLAAEDAQLPFDLSQGPLLRMKLVRVAENEYRLYMTLHQIILDGVTAYQVFLPELVALYEAFSAGKPSPLPGLQIQGGDYACWERESLESGKLSEHVAYWRRQLAGEIPILNLPTDRPRPALQSFRGAMYPLSLPRPLVDAVRRMSQHQGATLFMAMVAAFYVVLRRYTGQDDIILGTLTASRRRPEVEKLLGYFVNPVVLRLDLSGNPSFLQLLARVRDVVLDAISHDEVPFEYLVKELHPFRDVSRNPLFQIMVSLEPPMPTIEGWSMTQFDVASGASKFDLYLDLDDRDNGIIGPITYNPDLFDRETIARLVGHWQTILQAVTSDPQRKIDDLPILTQTERQDLLDKCKGPQTKYPSCTLAQLFEAQVAHTPNSIAVQDDHLELTYSQLNRRANQLARYLRARGLKPGELAGICTDRSLDMLIALLAVVKAGGTYVPLDPSYPKERVALMLLNSGARVVLTQKALGGRLPESEAKLIFLDEERAAISQEHGENLPAPPNPETLAYVIYTSGSTGVPKGVEVTHRSLVNFLVSMRDRPGLSDHDTLLSVTTLSFDIAGLELFLPLICGARIVLANSSVAQNGGELLQRLKTCGATVMQGTPTTWRMLIESGWQGDPELKVLCGGEALPSDLANDLLQRSSSVWNMYGPTETTIWSAVSRLKVGQATVDIGEPIANTDLRVLDASGQMLPLGIPGELHIGGHGLARGYRNQPELTRAKFIPDLFSNEPSARLYKTGDLVRMVAHGHLQFLGRLDSQVKVRGFRIELDEIQDALRKHPAVQDAAVGSQEDSFGEKRLVAYLVPRSATPAIGELRTFLEGKLPAYMVPTKFVFLNSLPLTPNGKLDWRGLSLAEVKEEPIPAFLSPRNRTEEILCEIWEAILGVHPISITQNFFSLGGHSLLVARMILRIERALGRRLSLADVFQAPTIEQMARRLGRESDPAPSGVVALQPRGSKPPLFWVRGGPLLIPLAQRLGTDQPFLGLHLTTQEAAELPADCTLEQVAGLFVRKLKQLQPTGPYYLGGLCIDAVLAYEIACQLLDQHEKIALLAMVDAHNPLFYNDFSRESRFFVMRRRVAYHLKKLASVTRDNLGAYLRDRWDGAQRRIDQFKWQAAYHLHRHRSRGGLEDLDYIVHPAADFYHPRPYTGQVSFFQSTDWPAGKYWDFQLGWRHLVHGNLNVCRIPGGHKSTFYEANVETLASGLKRCLEQAHESSALTSHSISSPPNSFPNNKSAVIASQLPATFIRVATFDDYEGISALQAKYFPETKPFEEWTHLWSDNPVYKQLPDWPIGWVVQNDKQQIVGHLGNVPLTFELAGREILATTCYSLVVDAQYRTYSLPLLSRFFGQKRIDLVVDTTVNANACRAHEVFRARRVPVGAWSQSAFWITNPQGFLASWLLTKGMPMAKTLSYPFSVALRAKDIISRKQLPRHTGSVDIQSTKAFDDRFETFWQNLRRVRAHQLLATRSPEVLKWHFKYSLANDRAWIATISNGSTICAYAIFHRHDNPTFDLKRMRLIDFQSLANDNELLVSLVCWALERCRKQGIHMLETIGLSPDKQRLLDQLAPYKRDLPSWLYFYKANDPALAAELESANVWDPSWFDGDASL